MAVRKAKATTTKTAKATKTRSRRKPPVKCQVKTFADSGRCIGHDFFDTEDDARSFAETEKEKKPDLKIVVALYHKANLLEPTEYYEV